MKKTVKYVVLLAALASIIGIMLLAKGTAMVKHTSTAMAVAPQGPPPSLLRVPVMVTGLPLYPNGTQAMVVYYSNVQVQESNGVWVNAPGNGSIDFTATADRGKILAYANVTANATVNAVRFGILSANIVVQGTSYSLNTSDTVTGAVAMGPAIAPDSAVLIDVSPVAIMTYNQSSKTFVMAHSAKALIAPNPTINMSLRAGTTVPLDYPILVSIAAATPPIAITSALITASGNLTVISVTVKNNGDGNVTLNNLVVYGPLSGIARPATRVANASAVNHSTRNITPNILPFQAEGFTVAGSDGSLARTSPANLHSGGGLILGPNESATLSFNDIKSYESGLFVTLPSTGSGYQVFVTGSDGAMASNTVTASS